jgi:adenylate cyclase class IV
MSDQFTEIEFKYSATGVELADFQKAIEENFLITKRLTISGYDSYFSKPDGSYLRHRFNSDRAELTVKQRTTGASTTTRVEVDVHLAVDQVAEIAALAKVLGYEQDRTIYKTCVILWGEHCNFVYYIVYDTAMDELGRFIEIEANKGQSTISSVMGIEQAERILQRSFPNKIGINKRLNLSMFERYSLLRRG